MPVINLRNKLISDLNFPVHDQALAKEILLKTGIDQGACLEIYSGNAFLSLALAQITKLKISIMENSQEKLWLASKNVLKFSPEKDIQVFKGDAARIPVPSGIYDLVLTKNLLFFRDKQADLYREIYRVLAPGGLACIFRQFGNDGETNLIHSTEFNSDFMLYLDNRDYHRKLNYLKKNLIQAQLPSFEIYKRHNLFWVFIWRSCIFHY